MPASNNKSALWRFTDESFLLFFLRTLQFLVGYEGGEGRQTKYGLIVGL